LKQSYLMIISYYNLQVTDRPSCGWQAAGYCYGYGSVSDAMSQTVGRKVKIFIVAVAYRGLKLERCATCAVMFLGQHFLFTS